MPQAPGWMWPVTIGLVALLVALDLRRGRGRALDRASARSTLLLYVGIAACFGLLVGAVMGADASTQFFTGYATEYSMSLDNLAVFYAIMHRRPMSAAAQ